VNYAKLLEMNSFFTLHSFLEVDKTQDLPSKFWQTLGDALRDFSRVLGVCVGGWGGGGWLDSDSVTFPGDIPSDIKSLTCGTHVLH
jgi:hypothetical protein